MSDHKNSTKTINSHKYIIEKPTHFNEIDIEDQINEINYGWIVPRLKQIYQYCKKMAPRQSTHNQLDRIKKLITTQLKQIFKTIRYQLKQTNLEFVFMYLKYISKIIGLQVNHQQLIINKNFMRFSQISQMHLIQRNIPDSSCIGCSKFFIKNFPLCSEQKTQQTHPFIILNENKFFQEEIRNAVCSLANQGGGFMLYTKKNIGNLLKQGIKKKKNEEIQQSILKRIRNSLNFLKGRQFIQLKIDVVPLKSRISSNLTFQNQQIKEFVVRIDISISLKKKLGELGFYIEHSFKNYKPVYKICRIQKISDQNLFWYQVKQIEKDYRQILKLASRVQNYQNKIRCRCLTYKGVELQYDIKSLIQQSANNSFTIQLNQQNMLNNICQGLQNYESKMYFPQILPKQSVALFQLNQNFDKSTFTRIIQSVFDHTKTKYRIICPFPELQKSIKKYKKQNFPSSATYEFQYCIYNGQFYHLMKQIKMRMKEKNISQDSLLIQEIGPKMRVGMNMSQIELKNLTNAILKQFSILPKVTKSLFNLSSTQIKFYNQISIVFQENEINAAIFTFLLLNFGKKRPQRFT